MYYFILPNKNLSSIIQATLKRRHFKFMKNTTLKIVTASMLASLICVATMIIKIPSPLSGYLNLGDGIVLLSGWLLPPVYGFLAAGVGSALADIFSGYIFYAPATFLIKGLMTVCAYYLFHMLNKRIKATIARIGSGCFAELFMIVGYYLFESCLYGFGPCLVNIPVNAIQGAVGLLTGVLLIPVFENNQIISFNK